MGALIGIGLTLVWGCGSEITETSDPSGSGGNGSGAGDSTTSTAGGTNAGGAHAGGANAGGENTGGGSACGDVGAPCSGTCPGDLVCYANGQAGFCIPAAPDCGGFAGALCEAPTPVCMTLSGADFGPCGTETVKQCVCAQSPSALSDC